MFYMSEKKTETIAFRTTAGRKEWLDRRAEVTRESISEWLNAVIDAEIEGRILPPAEDMTAQEAAKWRDMYFSLHAQIRMMMRLLSANQISRPLDADMLEKILELAPEDEHGRPTVKDL